MSSLKKFRPVTDELVGLCWDSNLPEWVANSEELGIEVAAPYMYRGTVWLTVSMKGARSSAMLRKGDWMLFGKDGSTRLVTAERLAEGYVEV